MQVEARFQIGVIRGRLDAMLAFAKSGEPLALGEIQRQVNFPGDGLGNLRLHAQDVTHVAFVGFSHIFQDFRLLANRTASENIAFALQVTGARANVTRTKVGRLLSQVGLASKSEALPGEMSGGEQQRVAIARALAHDPLVLLADEPTGNLDERATWGVFDLFRSINASGTAVLLATHDLELVRRNPGLRVLELDHGRLVYDSAAVSV